MTLFSDMYTRDDLIRYESNHPHPKGLVYLILKDENPDDIVEMINAGLFDPTEIPDNAELNGYVDFYIPAKKESTSWLTSATHLMKAIFSPTATRKN